MGRILDKDINAESYPYKVIVQSSDNGFDAECNQSSKIQASEEFVLFVKSK